MKIGYSILLGETLEARSLQYRDCERFQVVCPACSEPIFKVRRYAGSEDEMHYFAHYASDTAYQGRCDLRVAGMAKTGYEHANAVSREQRLAYFLSVLRRTIGLSPLYATSAERTHWNMNKAPAIELVRDLVWERTVLPHRQSLFDEGAGDYLWNLEDAGWALATSFSLSRQQQIGRDMWLMISTPAGHGNFNFLWNHAFVREVNALTISLDRSGALEREVMEAQLAYMTRMISARKSEVQALFDEMSHTLLPASFNKVHGQDDPTGDRSTFFSRTLSDITIQMMGTLLELPYFELLKQQYGDPGKVYPYQPGTEPVDADEIERMKTWRAQCGTH